MIRALIPATFLTAILLLPGKPAPASIASTNPPAPSITYITEHEGKAGASVTVIGSGLDQVSAVHFGNVPTPFTVPATLGGELGLELSTTAPQGSNTVDVTVEGSQGSSALVWADRWSYEPAPTIERSVPSEPPKTQVAAAFALPSDNNGVSEQSVAGPVVHPKLRQVWCTCTERSHRRHRKHRRRR